MVRFGNAPEQASKQQKETKTLPPTETANTKKNIQKRSKQYVHDGATVVSFVPVEDKKNIKKQQKIKL